MKSGSPQESAHRSPGPEPLDNFRSLSIRVLHYANLGVSRVGFLRQVSKILLDFSGCDALAIRAADGALYYCSEASRRPEKSFNFEILDPKSRKERNKGPCVEETEDLDRVCEDVMTGKSDPSSPFLSKNGSFWISDTDNPLASRQAADTDRDGESRPLSRIYKTILVVPFVITDENNGVLMLKSMEKYFFTEKEVELYESIAQNMGIAIAARRTRSECHERVKELTCLYGIAQLAGRKGLSTEELLMGIAALLPPAWQYPDIASGRIVLDGESYSARAGDEVADRQAADIVLGGVKRGFVEVAYSDERPQLFEGPFLLEERKLIDAIAAEIGHLIDKLEADETQAKLQEQLRHADRLATLGQLAAGIAHELNEPLGAILGFAQLAGKDPGAPEQTAKDLVKIVNASLHAREVVRKLLIFARAVPTKKTEVDLNKIVKDGIYFLESRLSKEQIELDRVLDPNLPSIFADPAQIHQVLVNLIVNAIQAMPGGGKLKLETKSDGDNVSLIVEDTGLGMSAEVLSRVFLPFFTTKDVGQGTGLGLAVVHGIVISHGGTVDVTSEVGKGSVFKVTLPVGGADGKGDTIRNGIVEESSQR